MLEFNYIEYLRKNPLLTENTIEIDGKEVDKSSLVIGGVDKSQGQDDGTTEAYFEEAYFEDGTPLNDSEIDKLNDTYSEYARERALDSWENLNEDEELNEDTSTLFREKQMVMRQLLDNMQQIASENPEELTHDFLLKVKEVIDELMITDF